MSIIRGDAQGGLLPRAQLDLFAKPSREYERVACTRCGREIVVAKPIKGLTYSEYQDKRGRCWGCDIEAKK